jgi:alpha-tubulin suppressor-like RCC1 family protein
MNRIAQLFTVLAIAALVGLSAPLPASAAPDSSLGVVKVAAGGDGANGHTCAILSDESMWCWGNNTTGQLGDPALDSTPVNPLPNKVSGNHHWATFDNGRAHTCGVDTGGALWCWGLNSTGQLGINVSSGFVWYSTPQQVGTATNWSGVTGLSDHTCAIKTTGTIWCWGYGDARLGIGLTPGDQIVPAQVGSDNHWVAIDAGEDMTCATKDNGTLWCWGHLDYTDWVHVTPFPIQIGTSTTSGWVGAGRYTACTISKNSAHALRCFGANLEGQGGNAVVDRTDLSEVTGGDSWISAGLGYAHTCAVKSTKTLWCFGDNTRNQLGIGAGAGTATPTAVGTDKSWIAVDSGYYHSCGITTGNDLYCWGANPAGQIGDGSYDSRATPVLVIDGTALPSTDSNTNLQRSIVLAQLALLSVIAAFALRYQRSRSSN